MPCLGKRHDDVGLFGGVHKHALLVPRCEVLQLMPIVRVLNLHTQFSHGRVGFIADDNAHSSNVARNDTDGIEQEQASNSRKCSSRS